MSEIMPALFVGHGSPMNIIMDNPFTQSLSDWGRRLPRPSAILVVSAHWMTEGTFVATTGEPRTIHDFYGFPRELYKVEYPAPGAPEAAELAAAAIRSAAVGRDAEWGLDHGAWSVLRHLFPAADVPVFQLSLDYSFHDPRPKPLSYHYELARELAALRRRGVLIIGSGNIVHNLSLIDFSEMDSQPYPWAVEFDEAVKARLVAGDDAALIDYMGLSAHAGLAVPTLDHYLPFIYVAALREKGEGLSFIYEGIQNASISMRCFQLG